MHRLQSVAEPHMVAESVLDSLNFHSELTQALLDLSSTDFRESLIVAQKQMKASPFWRELLSDEKDREVLACIAFLAGTKAREWNY